jgi:hypothetical protein
MVHAALSAAELLSLRKLTQGAAAEPIEAAHLSKLLELGYAQQADKALLITPLGCAVVAANFPDWPAER